MFCFIVSSLPLFYYYYVTIVRSHTSTSTDLCDLFRFNPDVNRNVCSQEVKIRCTVRQFQESWTTDFGFICRNDRAVCTLCCENVVCRTSRIKRHFETKHKKLFKDDSEKHEALKKAVSRYEKQSSIFKKLFAVQIKLRKVVTKLQDVSPSAGSLLPMVISLKKYLSIVPKFSLRICRIKMSFSQGLKICQCLLERWNDVLKTWSLT